MQSCRNKLVMLSAGVLAISSAALAAPVYIGVTPETGAGAAHVGACVEFLDASLNSISDFDLQATGPSDVATDGTLVYTSHPASSEIDLYTSGGTYQGVFANSPELAKATGIAVVGTKLAVATDNKIEYFDRNTPGAATAGFNLPTEGHDFVASEAISYNSATGILYALLDFTDVVNSVATHSYSIVGLNSSSGALLTGNLPDPAASQPFGGTAMAITPLGDLVVAGTNTSTNNWFIISATDGDIISQGNDGLNLTGLSLVPEPASLCVMGLSGALLLARRKR